MTNCLLASDSIGSALTSSNWTSAKTFNARLQLRFAQTQFSELSGAMPTLFGARIDFHGHQLYAARRVLEAPEPRMILADEVGLGKTVEAGLVIQSLLHKDAGDCVLVIVPGAMTRQWAQEMQSRFGARKYLQVENLRWKVMTSPQRQKLLQSERLIVSTSALLQHQEIQRALLARSYGVVVVDEAHQFDPASTLFSFLRSLSSKTKAFLALSATPSKTEVKSLAGLLSIVQGGQAIPVAKIGNRVQQQREIWEKLFVSEQFLTTGEALEPEVAEHLAEEWQGIIGDDLLVDELVTRLRQGEADALEQLFYYVQEHHRIDHRIVRTRRKQIDRNGARFSKRSFLKLDYEAQLPEVLLANHWEELSAFPIVTSEHLALRAVYFRRLCQTPELLPTLLNRRLEAIKEHSRDANYFELLLADPAPDEESYFVDQLLAIPYFEGEEAWLRTAAHLAQSWLEQAEREGVSRFDAVTAWIASHIAAHPTAKVVVFAQESDFADAYHRYLSSRVEFDIKCLLVNHAEATRTTTCSWFESTGEAAKVLISDESGAEGRNFQFADAVVHIDMPWSVSRIEQRIGRLDRLGRCASHEALSVITCGPADWEQSLVDIQAETFKVFSGSVGGLEFILPRLQKKILEAAGTGGDALRVLQSSLQADIDEQLKAQDQAFELSLDSSKQQLVASDDLANVLTVESVRFPEEALRTWAQAHGLQVEHELQTTQFSWSSEGILGKMQFFSAATPVRAVRGTFDRATAVQKPEHHLFGPGHCFIDELLALLQGSNEGRIAVCSAALGPSARRKLFILLAVRFCVRPLKGTSAGLMMKLERCLPPLTILQVLELKSDGRTSTLLPITDPSLNAKLRNPDFLSEVEDLTPAALEKLVYVGRLVEGLETCLPEALDTVVEQRRESVLSGKAQLMKDLLPRRSYLRWRSHNTDDEAELASIRKQLDQIDEVLRLPDQEEALLDGLGVVIGA